MALQAVLDSLDGIDAGIAAHYVQKDGKFHLDLQGGQAAGGGKDKGGDNGDGDGGDHGNAADKSGMIPKTRFNQVNEQKKAAEQALKEVVTELVEDISEDLRDLVPNLPPADQIKWIRGAMKRGIFGGKAGGDSGPDSKRPGGNKGADFANMSPQAIMATGYKTAAK